MWKVAGSLERQSAVGQRKQVGLTPMKNADSSIGIKKK